MYKVSSVYSPEHDTGILWNSVNIPWQIRNPIISQRDQSFIEFPNFRSLF
jgi:dTDP-4-dehydrorhamnose 3,5-epimerase